MFLIICCLISRFICLCVVFLPKGHIFTYLEITTPLPVSFKYIMILYVFRFKLNVKYVTEQRSAPKWVRPAIFAVEVITILVSISIPFGECFIENDQTELVYHSFMELSVCGTIMILSIVLMYKIFKKMNYGYYMHLRKWLLIIEVQL